MAHREAIQTEEFTYTVAFHPEPEGGYTVTVPALRGCISYGETLDEARVNIAEAIEGYLDALRKAGDPIPAGEEPHRETHREAVTVKLSMA